MGGGTGTEGHHLSIQHQESYALGFLDGGSFMAARVLEVLSDYREMLGTSSGLATELARDIRQALEAE